MEPEIELVDSMVKLFLRNAFIRNGSVALKRDENGEATNIEFGFDENCGLTDAICPYCGETNNSHELSNTGLAITAKVSNEEEPEDLEINGFRCVSCTRTWLMLVSDKGWGISLGLKATKTS